MKRTLERWRDDSRRRARWGLESLHRRSSDVPREDPRKPHLEARFPGIYSRHSMRSERARFRYERSYIRTLGEIRRELWDTNGTIEDVAPRAPGYLPSAEARAEELEDALDYRAAALRELHHQYALDDLASKSVSDVLAALTAALDTIQDARAIEDQPADTSPDPPAIADVNMLTIAPGAPSLARHSLV